jgi:hypothetical protein
MKLPSSVTLMLIALVYIALSYTGWLFIRSARKRQGLKFNSKIATYANGVVFRLNMILALLIYGWLIFGIFWMIFNWL